MGVTMAFMTTGVEKAEQPRRAKKIDLGTSMLALNFEAGSDLPPSMHREVLRHGWSVADASSYPVVDHRDRDGYPRPLIERDVRIMTAIAETLAEFFPRHRRIFEEDSGELAIETLRTEDGVEVRLGYPCEDAEPFTLAPSRRTAGGSTRAPGPSGGPKDRTISAACHSRWNPTPVWRVRSSTWSASSWGWIITAGILPWSMLSAWNRCWKQRAHTSIRKK